MGSKLETTTVAFKNMHRDVEPTSKPGPQEVGFDKHLKDGALPAQDRLMTVKAACLQNGDTEVENVVVGATFVVTPVILVM